MALIHTIKRTVGVADQFAVTARVSYPGYDERINPVTFVQSLHGGPIVMVCAPSEGERGRDIQAFVAEAVKDRLGHELTEDWVREFFATKED